MYYAVFAYSCQCRHSVLSVFNAECPKDCSSLRLESSLRYSLNPKIWNVFIIVEKTLQTSSGPYSSFIFGLFWVICSSSAAHWSSKSVPFKHTVYPFFFTVMVLSCFRILFSLRIPLEADTFSHSCPDTQTQKAVQTHKTQNNSDMNDQVFMVVVLLMLR